VSTASATSRSVSLLLSTGPMRATKHKQLCESGPATSGCPPRTPGLRLPSVHRQKRREPRAEVRAVRELVQELAPSTGGSATLDFAGPASSGARNYSTPRAESARARVRRSEITC
jgi:hypothetical protein